MRTLGAALLVAGLVLLAPATQQAQASSHDAMSGKGGSMMAPGMMAPGLAMPEMNSAQGRKLFASKGCVGCYSVNVIGGTYAPALDAATMPTHMNPFEFAAKMWRGADAMIYLQREELGEKIEFTGEEFGNIVAFTHDAAEQKKFSEADIPPRIKDLMHHMEEEEPHEEGEAH